MEVVDGEVASIKAATASVQNPWDIRFYEKSFPNHVQRKYNNKLSWQIARKVKNARKKRIMRVYFTVPSVLRH